MIILQFIILILIIRKKKKFEDVYEHFMEYNPVRPSKNALTKGVAALLIGIIQLAALTYILFVLGAAFNVFDTVSLQEFFESWGVILESSAAFSQDPYIFLYFFIGVLIQVLFQPDLLFYQ